MQGQNHIKIAVFIFKKAITDRQSQLLIIKAPITAMCLD
jgi:hypothetical protein